MNADSPGWIAAVRGPIVMITIGVLFLLDKFTPFQFGQTWPVILIVLGALALAGGPSARARRRAQQPFAPPFGGPDSPPPPQTPRPPSPGARR